jgi:dTDP-4-amino-4,6-dideoxygalactose transaminase
MIEYENLAKSNEPLLAELQEVTTRVIRSDWYIGGGEVTAFEQEFAAYLWRAPLRGSGKWTRCVNPVH